MAGPGAGDGGHQDSPTLADFRRQQAGQPVSDAASAAAAAAAARFGDAARAVIFYGSHLRDGEAEDGLFDFYVIVGSYRAAYARMVPALANAVLPPNVFYTEAAFDGRMLRAKVAVLSMADLIRLAHRRTFNPTLWARLAQPVRLLHVADGETAAGLSAALAEATRAMAAAAAPMVQGGFTSEQFWRRAFSLTYRSELRAERSRRGGDIYDREAVFFDATLARLAAEKRAPIRADAGRYAYVGGRSRRVARILWLGRQVQGKILTVLRLIKAAFTFDGGADYLAWKISRHSGVAITLTPWQRRHPILAGIFLFGRLWRRRAIR